MDEIEFMGHRLRIVRYNGPLYRADATFFSGQLASQNYAGAPMKYFTLAKSETSAYTKYGKRYVKTWRTLRELILLDILHPPTRQALSTILGTPSINVAFPMRNQRVSRVSTENTRSHNDTVLRGICELGIVDGYIMNSLPEFHSEVGLCPHAFGDLQLVSVDRNTHTAPPGPTRKRPAKNYRRGGRAKTTKRR